MASKLFIFRVFILISLIWPAVAYPVQPSYAINQLIPRTDAQNQQSEDHTKKIADIFDIPLDDDREVNLENCTNIVCMPYYLCIENLVVTNGEDLLEPRINVDKETRVDKETGRVICEYMEMPCCADEAIKKLHPVKNQSEESNDYDEDSKVFSIAKEISQDIKAATKCGYRKKGTTSTRISNGNQAQPNEFPWMVTVFQRLPGDNLKYICSGSLIHESAILTGAHFVDKYTPEQLVIRVGEHNILEPQKSNDDTKQEQRVTNIIVHKNRDGFINDIALIVLKTPFKLTDAVNTICLPPQSFQTKDNVMCTSSGWKRINPKKNKTSLDKAQLPIVEKDRCKNLLRRLDQFYIVDDSLICAIGRRRENVHHGGSAVFCEIPHDAGRFYQTGIVVTGIGNNRNIPALFVDVAHFANWIRRKLSSMDLYLEQQNILHHGQFN